MSILNKYSPILTKSKLRALVAKPWLIPDKVLAYVLTTVSRSRRLRTDSFGWLHAILYTSRIDVWQRYASVAEQIKWLNERPINILDVGGGAGTIEEFLDSAYYNLCVLDIKMEALRGISKSRLAIIAGDGCTLPLKDNSFDVVMSADSLEHVPDAKKANYCRELIRVARNYVIIHCPADSLDGKFQGTIYDTRFLEWYKHRFKKDEPNTLEYLKSGLPKIQELTRLFPRAIIMGKQNGEVWLRYMARARTPYLRFINGLFYKLRLQREDNTPPYHACLLVWRKR